MLLSKTITIQLLVSKEMPQKSFRRGFILAQKSSIVFCFWMVGEVHSDGGGAKGA